MSLKCVLKAIALSNSIDTKKYEDCIGFKPLRSRLHREVKSAEEAKQQRWVDVHQRANRQPSSLLLRHNTFSSQAPAVSSLPLMSQTRGNSTSNAHVLAGLLGDLRHFNHSLSGH